MTLSKSISKGYLFELLHSKSILQDVHFLYNGFCDKEGYGVIKIFGKSYQVTRLIMSVIYNRDYRDYFWTANHIDSLCSHRNCWNPDHLYCGNQSSNTKDAVKRGTHPQARKTHCRNGHEYSPENTYHFVDGRYCKICERAKRVRLRDKKLKEMSSFNDTVS